MAFVELRVLTPVLLAGAAAFASPSSAATVFGFAGGVDDQPSIGFSEGGLGLTVEALARS
ncbi:hypothetical protein KHP62_06075 [Rhodobacteraceae bacterium NNCM2]|nr:hypothetical protein [Coraliihabitans acroporae]